MTCTLMYSYGNSSRQELISPSLIYPHKLETVESNVYEEGAYRIAGMLANHQRFAQLLKLVVTFGPIYSFVKLFQLSPNIISAKLSRYIVNCNAYYNIMRKIKFAHVILSHPSPYHVRKTIAISINVEA